MHRLRYRYFCSDYLCNFYNVSAATRRTSPSKTSAYTHNNYRERLRRVVGQNKVKALVQQRGPNVSLVQQPAILGTPFSLEKMVMASLRKRKRKIMPWLLRKIFLGSIHDPLGQVLAAILASCPLHFGSSSSIIFLSSRTVSRKVVAHSLGLVS